MNFPPGVFSIGLGGLVLDVRGNSNEPGTAIILWTPKQEGNENQKWICDGVVIRNLRSGLVLSVPSLSNGAQLDQQISSSGAETQQFVYNGSISPLADLNLVLGAQSQEAGSCVSLMPRNGSDLQQWEII
ncbi:hypothetical protein BGX27_005152, partial [Mortierella sp. AM989]